MAMSQNALARWKNYTTSLKKRAASAGKLARERVINSRAKNTGYMLTGALAAGFLRGKMEEADGTWNLFGVVDGELAIGIGLLGAGFYMANQKVGGAETQDLLVSAGSGVMSHYVGQVARKYAKTGSFSQVAGGFELVGRSPADTALSSALSQSVGAY